MFKNIYVQRILISMALGLAVGIVLSEVTFYFLGETAREPATITMVVPAGTADLIAHGGQPALPIENTIFVNGDVLVIDNQDSANHQLGPLWIPAGTKGQLVLGEAQNGSVECSFQASQYLGLDVRDSLTTNTRITGILNAGLPLGALLAVYSVLLPAKKEEEKENQDNVSAKNI
ncbi:MAG: hypothetical protein IT311_13170 [Anaerolineales bacterium]|nr:hypothetical protein [Anaerolineales bacterium]MCZ2121209.1 hypothetical protein [Anaerolineales bacterium]